MDIIQYFWKQESTKKFYFLCDYFLKMMKIYEFIISLLFVDYFILTYFSGSSQIIEIISEMRKKTFFFTLNGYCS